MEQDLGPKEASTTFPQACTESTQEMLPGSLLALPFHR